MSTHTNEFVSLSDTTMSEERAPAADESVQELQRILERGRRLAQQLAGRTGYGSFVTAEEILSAPLNEIEADPFLAAAYQRGWLDRADMMVRILQTANRPPTPYGRPIYQQRPAARYEPRQTRPTTSMVFRVNRSTPRPVQPPATTTNRPRTLPTRIPAPPAPPARTAAPPTASTSTSPAAETDHAQPVPRHKTPSTLRRDQARRKAHLAAKRAAKNETRKAERAGPSQMFRLQNTETPSTGGPTHEPHQPRPGTSQDVEMTEPENPVTVINPDTRIDGPMDTSEDAILETPGPTLSDVPEIEADPASFYTLSPPTSPRDE